MSGDKVKISEEQFLKQVIMLANAFHWKVAHFRTSLSQSGKWITAVQGDGKGFPDLVLVRLDPPEVIFAELKSQKGRLSPEQKEWLDLLKGSGQQVYVWRPDDYGDIKLILS